jgi:hypothetical protein
LVAKLAPPQSSQVELVSAHWSQARKARLWVRAALAYMHSIAKLQRDISEERRALRAQCLAAQLWAPVSALRQAVNEPRQSAQARAQQVLIFTRDTHVASVITDVIKLIKLVSI